MIVLYFLLGVGGVVTLLNAYGSYMAAFTSMVGSATSRGNPKTAMV